MARPKQDRHRLNLSPLKKTVRQLNELAAAENRSLTSYLEVLLDKTYNDNWPGAAGEQPGLKATPQTSVDKSGAEKRP